MADASFWEQTDNAAKITKQFSKLQEQVNSFWN